MRKTNLDGEGPFKGSDIWSIRHLFRLQDEQDRDRVTTISLYEFLDTLKGNSEISAVEIGERFKNERLAPALRRAILDDRYVRVNLDAETTPSLLETIFGGIALEAEGFTAEQLTERLAVMIVTEKQTYFGREAIDHLHNALETRLRSAETASI